MTSTTRQVYARRNGGQLTGRERETLHMLGKGLTNKEIARLHNVTPATVQDHIKAIYAKLDVSNRVEAAVWAAKQGML